jgi:hypothetical protein
MCPSEIIRPSTKTYPVSRAVGSGQIIFGNITKLTRDSYDGAGHSFYLTTPAIPTTLWIQDTIWKWSGAEVHATCGLYQHELPGVTIIDSVTNLDYLTGSAVPLQTRQKDDETTCVYDLGCDGVPEGGGGGTGGGGYDGPYWETCVYTVYYNHLTGQELYRTLDYCYYE